jgi:c-di-GMP-binding flagellar brake protein YcgR
MCANNRLNEKKAGRERRIHPRIRERNSVAVRVVSAPDTPSLVQKVFFCTTEDLSAGGMRFNVHTAVPVNSHLELRVAVKNPTGAYKHVGRVVWVKEMDGTQPYAVGVQFTDTPATTLAAWKEFVALKLAQHGKEQENRIELE